MLIVDFDKNEKVVSEIVHNPDRASVIKKATCIGWPLNLTIQSARRTYSLECLIRPNISFLVYL